MTGPSLRSMFEKVLESESGRMMVIRQTPFLFAVVNDSGRASLFVRVSLSPSQVISDGRGFGVKTSRNGNNNYVQITASGEGLPSLFLMLIEYLLDRVSATMSTSDGIEALTRSIDEYRRFVGQRLGRLSDALVRGTFVELVFLRSIIAAGMSAENAVDAWRGPWAKTGLGVHDFTFPDGRGIEIKSTHQPPHVIRVSSPSQLVPSGQPLDLLVLPVEDAPDDSTAAVMFRKFVQETRDIMVATSPVASEKWDSAMQALNLDCSDEWYDKYRFLPGEWQRFSVTSGFPHLDIPSLPAGIIDLHYSLELLKLVPFARPFGDLLHTMGLS